MQTWMILDGIVIAIAATFTVVGCVRGFIKSAVRLIGAIAAAIAAAFGASPIATWLYETVFYTSVEQFVEKQIQDGAAMAAQSLSDQITAITTSLPQGLQSVLALLGTETMIQDGAAQTADKLLPTVMEQLVTPLCMTVLQAIAFLALFFTLFILIHLLGIWMDKIFSKKTSTKTVNRVLGAVLGLAESVPLLLALCLAVQIYLTLAGAQSVFNVEDIEQTYILEWLMQVNPLM